MRTQGGGRVEIEEVCIRFDQNGLPIHAVDGCSLSAAPGEFIALLGPSGCGKSTLLNAVAGFVFPARGEIRVDGAPVTGPGADRGVVFQQPALFPWKTVLENVEFGLKMRGVRAEERVALAQQFVALVGLRGFERSYPAQLSGGMQQRVAIARVLVNNPRVVLMDEPFAALDAQARVTMQELLLQIWANMQITVLFVTHDVDEALFLADRVLVMTSRPGRVRAELPVPLPRPRTIEMTTEPTFVALKREALALVREESLKMLVGAPAGRGGWDG